MKNLKKISALLIALALLATSLFTGGMIASAEALEKAEMNTTKDYYNNLWSADVWGAWYAWENATNFYEGNSIAGNGQGIPSITYKVAYNSPFDAQFYYDTGNSQGGKPVFYASGDASSWVEIPMIYTASDSTFYTDGIGADNCYVKIVICDNTAAPVWACRLEKVSFDAFVRPAMDTVWDFYDGDFWNGPWGSWYDGHNIGQFYEGRAISAATGTCSDAYIVYRTAYDSPVEVKMHYDAGNSNGGKPLFYVSGDGMDWTEIEMEYSGQDNTFYTHRIGEENNLIKILFNSNPDAPVWASRLEKISYNAYVDSGVRPSVNTTLDFVNNFGNGAWAGIYTSNGVSGSEGVVGKGYVIVKVEKNSPFYANFAYFGDPLWAEYGQYHGQNPGPLFYASTDCVNWKPMRVDSTTVPNGRECYKNTVGKNEFVKIVICGYEDEYVSSFWYCRLLDVSFNQNTAAAPTYNKTLNFVADYDGGLAEAVDYEGLHDNTGENGLTAAMLSFAYATFEMDKGSAFKADFKIFADNTANRPTFFASADGEDWVQLDVKGTSNGNDYTYTADSIGANNKYLKVQINDDLESVYWANDFRGLSYNFTVVDPNGDGVVDADDIVAIRKQLLGIESDYNIDFNRDGSSDIRDLVAIKKYLA